MDSSKENAPLARGGNYHENTRKLYADTYNYDRLYGQKKVIFDRSSLPAPINYLFKNGLLKKIPRGEWASIMCPKHKNGTEKNASLRISCIDGHFKCHACGIKGRDILALHQIITGLTFIEAVRDLGGSHE